MLTGISSMNHKLEVSPGCHKKLDGITFPRSSFCYLFCTFWFSAVPLLSSLARNCPLPWLHHISCPCNIKQREKNTWNWSWLFGDEATTNARGSFPLQRFSSCSFPLLATFCCCYLHYTIACWLWCENWENGGKKKAGFPSLFLHFPSLIFEPN